MTNSSPAARTARPARRAAHAEYVRERARLTIPTAEIAAASDLELMTLYAEYGEYRPVLRRRERARQEYLRQIRAELVNRGVQRCFQW